MDVARNMARKAPAGAWPLKVKLRNPNRPISGPSVAACHVAPPSSENSALAMPLPLSQAMPDNVKPAATTRSLS